MGEKAFMADVHSIPLFFLTQRVEIQMEKNAALRANLGLVSFQPSFHSFLV